MLLKDIACHPRDIEVAPVDEAAPVVDDDVHPVIAADATAVIVFFVITFMTQVNARRLVKWLPTITGNVNDFNLKPRKQLVTDGFNWMLRK